MPRSPRLTRRATLRAAVLGSLLAALGWRPAPAAANPVTRLTAIFRHRDSAVRLGEAYLAAHPEEADPGHLTHRTLTALGDVSPPDADLRPRLAAACRRDFAEGRTVQLDGWILAETELRACALVALSDRVS